MPHPEPGQVVRVRSRRFLVEEVVPRPTATEYTLARLSCLEDDAQGQPLSVFWEAELDAEVLGSASFDTVAVRGFDPPRIFGAYLHAQRWNAVTSTDPNLFQSPYRAGIEVMAYQLEPLRMALLLPRVNLFIADDVGLGKTIEAGLILRELILRQKVRRVVVACPPSVLLQWRDELEARFGLTFVIYDREYVTARRRERGYGVNPWDTHSRFLISHSLLRDEAYAAPLRDWLGAFKPGSLLILDEAHNAAPASSAKYAIDSQLTRAVRDLAPRFEHRLFLSATPHNGHSNSFAALLEILDPLRFCRGVPVKGAKVLESVMVRRLKGDLRGIVPGIPVREAVQVDITGLPEDAPELVLSRLLEEYRHVREERMKHAARSVQAASALVITSLQKRLLSSIAAFAITLRVHCRTLEKKAAKESERQAAGTAVAEATTTPALLQQTFPLLSSPPGADDEDEEKDEAELAAKEAEEMERASAQAALAQSGDEALARRQDHLLEQMTRIAEEAMHLPDPRVHKLVDWIRTHQCPTLAPLGHKPKGPVPVWNDRRLLLFTEYLDTKTWLEEKLNEAIAFTDQADSRISAFIGGNDQRREEVKRAFNGDPAEYPLRILIATDAAREGVNLQNHCSDLFHFDVPWNPSRMEQRNGRIDRKLQKSDTVRCHYFYFAQRPADRVLRALVEKTQTIQKELGSLAKVLEGRLEKMMDGGIRPIDAERLAASIANTEVDARLRVVTDEELEGMRPSREKQKLLKRLEELQDLLETSRKYLDLDEARLRAALSASLSLSGAGELLPEPGLARGDQGEYPEVWRFPDLDRGRGADASWAETLDTLRRPRKRDQSIHDWRRESPIRPVIFEDVGSLDDAYVHLHLEHRVVQRLLGRFLTEGFIQQDLSRASVLGARAAIARVILLGRLSLYGDRAARLHDQIICVSARWIVPATRKEPLRPYGSDAEKEALGALAESLQDERFHHVDPAIQKVRQQAVSLDVGNLLPTLQARADEARTQAERDLAQRGERESKELARMIEQQEERIRAELEEREGPQQQLLLNLNEDESRQREADRRHMRHRLESIGAELSREPERIRKSYSVRAHRLEPLGLVYLVPLSG